MTAELLTSDAVKQARSIAFGTETYHRTVHVHGGIYTPDSFHKAGTVVLSDGVISAVYPTRTTAGEGAVDFDAYGIVFPGLVDAHNHPEYAAFPRWLRTGRYFKGRFDWRSKTRCGIVVVGDPDPYYRKQIADPYKAITKANLRHALIMYGQVRALIGGASTVVLDAEIAPGGAPLPATALTRDPSSGGRLWALLDPTCAIGKEADAIRVHIANPENRLHVHCAEGTDEFARGEFLTLKRESLLSERTSLIHALGLFEEDWRVAHHERCSVIWSPMSNFTLYGRTIDIGLVAGLGIPVALAPDWTVTGSSTILDEAAEVAARYHQWIGPEMLVDMITCIPARLLGVHAGRISPGAAGDLLVLRSDVTDITRREAAAQLGASAHTAIEMVFVGGKPVYGTPEAFAQLQEDLTIYKELEVPHGSSTVKRLLGIAPAKYNIVEQLRPHLAEVGGLAPLWEPRRAV